MSISKTDRAIIFWVLVVIGFLLLISLSACKPIKNTGSYVDTLTMNDLLVQDIGLLDCSEIKKYHDQCAKNYCFFAQQRVCQERYRPYLDRCLNVSGED